MSLHFKIFAAALGLVVAAGVGVADASAKTVAAKTVVTKTVVTAHHAGHGKLLHAKAARIVVHPRHVGARLVKHVKVVKTGHPLHRAVIGSRLVKHVRIVKHVVKAPLQRHALAHRVIVR